MHFHCFPSLSLPIDPAEGSPHGFRGQLQHLVLRRGLGLCRVAVAIKASEEVVQKGDDAATSLWWGLVVGQGL